MSIRSRISHLLPVARLCRAGGLFLSLIVMVAMWSPDIAAAEPQDRPTHPTQQPKRLHWVSGAEEKSSTDRQALQMSREERQALRRELHESRKQRHHQRRERQPR